MPEKDHQGKGSVLNDARVEKTTSRPLENVQNEKVDKARDGSTGSIKKILET